MKLRRVNLGFLIGVSALLSGGCFTNAPPTDDFSGVAKAAAPLPCDAPEDEARLADQILQLVNLERAAADLPPVVSNPRLDQVAGDFACTMIRGRFFGHRDPASNQGPAARAIAGRYSFEAVGENLAAGQETSREVMRVWMDSPRHRAIILDPKWKEIGLAVRFGGEYGVYWVQEFGQPASRD